MTTTLKVATQINEILIRPRLAPKIRTALLSARRRIKALEDWVRTEGERNNQCTYYIMDNRICSNCQCQRKTKPPKNTEFTPVPPIPDE